MPVISAALFARFASRQDDSPAMKAVAALRNQFGGHAVTAAGPTSGAGEVDGASPRVDVRTPDVDAAHAVSAGPSGTGETR